MANIDVEKQQADGLLFRFVTNLIGFRRYKVNEFSAAVHHQLSSIVGHSDIRKSLFDHFIDSSSGDSEIIIVARRGSHSTFLFLAPRLLKTPQLWSTTPRIFLKKPPSESDPAGCSAKRVQKMNGGGAGLRVGNTRVCKRFRMSLGGKWGPEDSRKRTAPAEEGKARWSGNLSGWGTTFGSLQRGGRCRLTGPQRRRSRGKMQGHWPHRGTKRVPSGLGSTEPEAPLPLPLPPLLPPPPPAAVAAALAKPSFRHPRRRLTTCPPLPLPLLERRRPPGN
uniref:uncharacterized protein LOC128928287 n=1 Tax=Callithrix jacchus TaxID=9483 RepID=UPI0023DD2110|nr:uncharacterized protein LOC128928287 [Callithrix jacchus]